MKKIILVFISFVPYSIFAISNYNEKAWNKVKLDNPSPIDGSLKEMFRSIIEGLIQLMIPLLVLGLVYAGFLLIKAQGKKGELQKAKNAVMYVLIGIAIILSANLILKVFTDTVEEFQDKISQNQSIILEENELIKG